MSAGGGRRAGRGGGGLKGERRGSGSRVGAERAGGRRGAATGEGPASRTAAPSPRAASGSAAVGGPRRNKGNGFEGVLLKKDSPRAHGRRPDVRLGARCPLEV